MPIVAQTLVRRKASPISTATVTHWGTLIRTSVRRGSQIVSLQTLALIRPTTHTVVTVNHIRITACLATITAGKTRVPRIADARVRCNAHTVLAPTLAHWFTDRVEMLGRLVARMTHTAALLHAVPVDAMLPAGDRFAQHAPVADGQRVALVTLAHVRLGAAPVRAVHQRVLTDRFAHVRAVVFEPMPGQTLADVRPDTVRIHALVLAVRGADG